MEAVAEPTTEAVASRAPGKKRLRCARCKKRFKSVLKLVEHDCKKSDGKEGFIAEYITVGGGDDDPS